MKLGFIGTGKIASSVIRGICRSKISFTKILISPRNKKVSSNLKKKFKKVIFIEVYNSNNYSASWRNEKLLVLIK